VRLGKSHIDPRSEFPAACEWSEKFDSILLEWKTSSRTRTPSKQKLICKYWTLCRRRAGTRNQGMYTKSR